MTKAQLNKIKKLYGQGQNIRTIAERMKLSKSTISNALKGITRESGRPKVSPKLKALGLGRRERKSNDLRWQKPVPQSFETGQAEDRLIETKYPKDKYLILSQDPMGKCNVDIYEKKSQALDLIKSLEGLPYVFVEIEDLIRMGSEDEESVNISFRVSKVRSIQYPDYVKDYILPLGEFREGAYSRIEYLV